MVNADGEEKEAYAKDAEFARRAQRGDLGLKRGRV